MLLTRVSHVLCAQQHSKQLHGHSLLPAVMLLKHIRMDATYSSLDARGERSHSGPAENDDRKYAVCHPVALPAIMGLVIDLTVRPWLCVAQVSCQACRTCVAGYAGAAMAAALHGWTHGGRRSRLCACFSTWR